MGTPLALLIVEDSADDAELTVKALRGDGFDVSAERVETADAMRAALDGKPWDVIICDQSMPAFNASAALETLGQSGLDLPFIVVSGILKPAEAVALMKAGAHDFIEKNDLTLLAVAVERELREAETRRGRKRAEEALRESENQFRIVTDGIPALLAHVGADRRYRFANKTYEDWFGVPRESIQGRHVSDIHGDDGYAELKPSIDRVLSGQRVEFEKFIPDTRLGPMTVEGSLIPNIGPDGAVAGYFVLTRDITERKRAEQALRESEAQLKRAQEIARIGNFEWDEATDQVIKRSDVVYDIYGISPHEQPRTVDETLELVHPDDRERIRAAYAEKLGTGEGYDVEYRLLRADGEVRYVHEISTPEFDGSGAHVRSVGTVQDITDRRLAERQYRELYDNAPDMYCSVDMKTKKVIRCNQTLAASLGMSKDEIIGLPVIELYHPDSREKARDAFREFLETGQVHRDDLQIGRRDGGRIDVSLRVTAVRGEDGEILHSNSVWRDITNRRLAERQLVQSEFNLRQLIQSANAPIFAINKRRQITEWNDAAARITGRAKDEVLYCNLVNEFVTEASRDALDAVIDRALLGEGTVNFEFPILAKGGAETTILFSATPQRDEDGEIIGVIGVGQDITERKRAEEALRNSEARFRRLFEESPIGISVKDYSAVKRTIDSLRDQGVGNFREYFLENPETLREAVKSIVILDVNPAVVTIYGAADRDEFIRVAADPSRLASIEPYYLEEIVRMAEGESSFAIEHGVRAFDGKAVSVRTTRTIETADRTSWSRVISTDEDITERVRAEEARRDSEECLRAVIDNSPSAISLKDHLGRYIIINRAFEALIGMTSEEARGKTSFDLFPHSFEAWDVSHDREVLDTGVPKQREEVYSDGDGTRIFLTVKFPIRDADDRVIAVGAIHTDITERKRVEEEKALLESQLIQAQKMEAIGTLAGGIAHDFNNILAGMIGYCHLARDAIPDDSEACQDIGKVLKGIDRAAGLVTQILTFSRRGGEERKPIELYRVVLEVLEFIRASVPSTIDIQSSIDRDAGVVLADPTQIHQVMMNLFSNAADAIGEKVGVIEMSIAGVSADSVEALTSLNATSTHYVKLSVRDSGSGMDEETIARIFDPFFTTKEVGKGTGLGLAVVHGIISRHNGMIDVKSEPGKGTTVVFYLPCVDAAEKRATTSDEPIPTGSERILLIDDEIAVMQSLQRILSRLGYEVQTMASGTAALEALREAPDRYDIVVTDQTMPKLTGEALARDIFRIRPELPVILCSGYIKKPKSKRRGKNGIREFLLKPINPGELARTIRRVLDEDMKR